MLRFLQSSARLISRVVRRAMAGIVWWLLDVSDLYSNFVAPQLPENWVIWLQPYTVYLNVATPWVVAAIVIWAILYTYYEVEKQITRDPEIPKKLREFYVRSEPFIRLNLQNENQLPTRQAEFQNWINEVMSWISSNMSDAARSRFNDISGILPFRHNEAVSQDHSKLINRASKLRDNLQTLIENEAWDEKETKKEKEWRLANIFRSKKPANKAG